MKEDNRRGHGLRICLDGQPIEFEQAAIRCLTPAQRFASGVFEAARRYATDHGAAVFRLSECRAAGELGQGPWLLRVEHIAEQIVGAIKLAVGVSGFAGCHIRPVICGGRVGEI